jgi:hypothetical protein
MEILKILGQLVPVPTVLSNLYTVPASTMAAISTIIICNQNPSLQTSFRISLAIGGAADDPSQYIYYDLSLDFNDTFTSSIGLGLNTGDIVRVQSSAPNVSFNLLGVEVNAP